MRLKDKVILVTGSTAGIGEAMARRFVAEGAKVMIHGLEPDLGRAIVASLGSSAALYCNDLADSAAPAELLAATIEAFGQLDGLVNNAAAVLRSNIENTRAEVFDRCMAVNVRAPLLLVQAALPYLKQARGAVLNIGSVNAYCGEPNLIAYSASKGALMTLSRNLADGLATQGVRVNHINPGWVLTDNENKMQQSLGKPADWFDHVPRVFAPSGRLLRPADVAGASVYWIGDESRPVSGTVMELEQFPIIGRNPNKDDV